MSDVGSDDEVQLERKLYRKRKGPDVPEAVVNAPKCWKTAAEDLGLDEIDIKEHLRGLRSAEDSVSAAMEALRQRKSPTQDQWTDLMRETLDPSELDEVASLFCKIEPTRNNFGLLRWAAKCWGFVYPWDRFTMEDIAGMVTGLRTLPMNALDLWIMTLVQNDFVPAQSLGFDVPKWKRTEHYKALRRIEDRYLRAARGENLQTQYITRKENQGREYDRKAVSHYSACHASVNHRRCVGSGNVAAICAGSFILVSVLKSLGFPTFQPEDVDIFVSLPTIDYSEVLFYNDLPGVTAYRKNFSILNVKDPNVRGPFGTPELQFVLTKTDKLVTMVTSFDAAALQVYYDMHTDELYARPSALWQIMTKNMSLWWINPRPYRFQKYQNRGLYMPAQDRLISRVKTIAPSMAPLAGPMRLWEPKDVSAKSYDTMVERARWSKLIQPSTTEPLPNNFQVVMFVVARREVKMFASNTKYPILLVVRNPLTDRLTTLFPDHLQHAPVSPDRAFTWMPISTKCDYIGGISDSHIAHRAFKYVADEVLPCWCVLNIGIVSPAENQRGFVYPNQHTGRVVNGAAPKIPAGLPDRPCVLHIVPVLTNQKMSRLKFSDAGTS